jgi:hypothetical protein
MKAMLLFVVSSLPVGFGWAAEPAYRGRPLSQWLSQLQNKDPNIRSEAAQALGGFGPEAKIAIPDLIELL